jgi:2-succinyl-6-hydroxy-2,4-cyclohexadiene-1-carboxylate synthase
VLASKEWGEGDPIVLVHGFTQSSQAWEALAARLAARYHVVAVDAPGHGGSAGVRADLWESGTRIGEVGGPATYVGYSMGGRMVLHVALRRPDLVRRLVLVSATAGMDSAEERAARRASDEEIAQRIERDGIEAFVAWWLERPLFATLSRQAAAIDSRMGGTVEGLASNLRLTGTGQQEPTWDRLHQLAMPVLVMAGALDRPYVARAERMVGAIGANATLAIVEGAGHACHLERPDAWLSALEGWLDATA